MLASLIEITEFREMFWLGSDFMPCLIKWKRKNKDGKVTYESPVWYASWTSRDGRRLKKSTGVTDKAAAWKVLNTYVDLEVEIAKRSTTEAQLRKVIDDLLVSLGEAKLRDHSTREVLDGWIKSKTGAVAPSTLKAYRQAVKFFVEFLGARADRSIKSLTRADVVGFRDHLHAEGRTPTTVNKLIQKYLGGSLSDAVKEGLISYNLFSAVDGLKATSVSKDRFAVDQVAAIVAAARGTDCEGCALVGYTTGMRLWDAANLRWSAIDTEYGLITFHEGKNNKKVTVGLHSDLADWLSRQAPSDEPEMFLFPSLAGRECSGTQGLSVEFGRLMARAGVRGRELRQATGKGHRVSSLSFHSFRHGAATAVFNAAALKEITRRVTGHAQRGSLERYVHQDVQALKAATALIPRLPKA